MRIEKHEKDLNQMIKYLNYIINEDLRVRIENTSNGSILFEIMNILLNLAKKRKKQYL